MQHAFFRNRPVKQQESLGTNLHSSSGFFLACSLNREFVSKSKENLSKFKNRNVPIHFLPTKYRITASSMSE